MAKTRTAKKKSKRPEFIHQYVKQRVLGQKRVVGVMVGRLDQEGFIRLGWTRCNIKAGDVFNPKHGLKVALERSNAEEIVPIPHSFSKPMFDFQDRCHRYYKDATGCFKIAVSTKNQQGSDSDSDLDI